MKVYVIAVRCAETTENGLFAGEGYVYGGVARKDKADAEEALAAAVRTRAVELLDEFEEIGLCAACEDAGETEKVEEALEAWDLPLDVENADEAIARVWFDMQQNGDENDLTPTMARAIVRLFAEDAVTIQTLEVV